MTRRALVPLCLLLPGWVRAWNGEAARVRGRLVHEEGAAPVLRAEDGREWRLEGDAESQAVLHDERVRAEVFEAVGAAAPPDGFRIDPIYKKAMYVVRGGALLVITYWCEVCAIRTYSPGKCQCCQDETALDPRDPALEQQAR
jgi:hypothetical protein